MRLHQLQLLNSAENSSRLLALISFGWYSTKLNTTNRERRRKREGGGGGVRAEDERERKNHKENNENCLRTTFVINKFFVRRARAGRARSRRRCDAMHWLASKNERVIFHDMTFRNSLTHYLRNRIMGMGFLFSAIDWHTHTHTRHTTRSWRRVDGLLPPAHKARTHRENNIFSN